MAIGSLRIPRAFIVAALVLVACSGASSPQLGSDAPANAPTGSGDPTSTAGDSAVSDSGPLVDDSAARSTDAAPAMDAASCPGGSMEAERNDDPRTANPLVGTVCGAASTASDVDFFTFTLHPTTQHLHVHWHGNIVVKLTVNGKTAILSAPASDPVPFADGSTYLVEVRSKDGLAQDYTFTVTES